MTQEQKDAVWQSLPEDIREELRMKFEETHHVDKDMYDSGWNGATSSLLIKLFGKHNLTSTPEDKPHKYKVGQRFIYHIDYSDSGRIGEIVALESNGEYSIEWNDDKTISHGFPEYYIEPCGDEPKPKEGHEFKIGDLVLVKEDFDFGTNFGLAYIFCITPHPIINITDGKAFLRNDWDGSNNSEYALVPLDSLIPYTEVQEPKDGRRVDFSSSSLQNEISSLSKEDAEELTKCLAELDDSIREFKTSQVDWLAYRMELAKEVVKETAYRDKKPGDIVDITMTIVDGIIERLRGGDGK